MARIIWCPRAGSNSYPEPYPYRKFMPLSKLLIYMNLIESNLTALRAFRCTRANRVETFRIATPATEASG